MTSSTFNFKKTVWICVGIYLLLIFFQPFLALISGSPFIDYDISLNGARIFNEKEKKISYLIPKDLDYYLFGTSRTLSVYSPKLLSQNILRDCNKEVRGFNIGDPTLQISDLRNMIEMGRIKNRLVIEYHPFLFMDFDQDLKKKKMSSYQGYATKKKILEQYIKGWFSKLFKLDYIVKINSQAIKSLISKPPKSLKHLYLQLELLKGYGQIQKKNGHVSYRAYLSNPKDSNLLKEIIGKDPERYLPKLRTGTISQSKIEILKDSLRLAREKGIRVIISRPPYSNYIYNLEEEYTADLFKNIQMIASSNQIELINFHGLNYSSLDGSHIDGFELIKANSYIANMFKPSLFSCRN